MLPRSIQEMLDFYNSGKAETLDIHVVRDRVRRFAYHSQPCPYPVNTFRNSCKVEEGEIPVYVCVPQNLSQPQLPVMFYLHGGGHATGDFKLYASVCEAIAHICQVVLVFPEYRLAPEFPYPIGLNDCLASFKQLNEILVEEACANLKHIVVAGDSAGGNLAASLVYQLKKIGEQYIQSQILIYPSLDFTMSSPSIERLGKGYLLERTNIEWYFKMYLAETDPKKISPLFFEESALFPSTQIVVAGFDPLRDEALSFAQKLMDAHVHVQLNYYPDLIHAFMQLSKLIPQQVEQLFNQMAHFIQQRTY